MSKRRSQNNIDMDKRIYDLELKFKAWDLYDKEFKKNDYALKNTLELENKINDLNKKNKQSIILDKTFCLVCHKKKLDHINKIYCYSLDKRSKYKPFNKKLIEVKV